MRYLNSFTNITRVSRCTVRKISSVVVQPPNDTSTVENEPILEYNVGSMERNNLKIALDCIAGRTEDIPIVIGDQEIREGEPQYQVMPHNHQCKIARFYNASDKTIQWAIQVAAATQQWWDRTPIEYRLCIFERAADLIANQYRASVCAATMHGQSKTVIQAEIDAACEFIDFLRFNAYFLKQNCQYQPISVDSRVTKNSIRHRGIEGFIAAIAPFNFTAIGGNLACTPAMMGNSVLWKPSNTAVLSNWRLFNILREAGMPPGVLNFIPSDGPVFGKAITSSELLAGINFTGSVPTFNWLWRAVGENINKYNNYPRLVGECGGKNYHFVHPSADVGTVVGCTIRSAFEYCGQKCSACSRLYCPESLWSNVSPGLLEASCKLAIGDVSNFSNFTGAVIDEKAFNRIVGYIEEAKKSKTLKIIGGGKYDKKTGYFIEPTIIQSLDPCDKMLKEEIFGPVLTVWVYPDCRINEAMSLAACSTPFALTGAIFAQDECWLHHALNFFRFTAGNFYINDKSTGAIVGQQPFGGGRHSGTNDKAGGPNYILRWSSPQAIKETFVPMPGISYPYMDQKDINKDEKKK